MAKQEEHRSGFEGISWEPGKIAEALTRLRDCVKGKGVNSVAWYYGKKKKLKGLGHSCRLGAILLTAAAGLLPMANEIYEERALKKRIVETVAKTDGTVPAPPPSNAELVALVTANRLNPAWSALFLGLAAMLVGIDRFYGATSGYVRFMLTAQQIQQAVDEFEIDFETQKAGWTKPDPAGEQISAALAVSRKLLVRVNELVYEETKMWAAEFAAALKDLDKQVEVARESSKEGAIQVVVTNGEQCANGWRLTLGNGFPENRRGKQASVEVIPGTYRVRVTGVINNKEVQDEKAVQVKPGEIQPVELTLA